MKTVALFMMAVLIIISGGMVKGQEKKSKTETVKIKVSSQCGMCKDRIEKELAFTKGVTAAVLNLETHEVEVTFKTSKTTADNIREVITKVGYDADDKKANEEAYSKLPLCCKKPEDGGGHGE